MTGCVAQPLCICNGWVIAVLLVSAAVTLIYGELLSRDATHRQATIAEDDQHQELSYRLTVAELRDREDADTLPYYPDVTTDRLHIVIRAGRR